ncbi:MAG TPA: DeoR family transcriptional regulator [Candidatus Paceibacterota bacterium]
MFADKKTQDIGLALIKLSVYAKRHEFRHKLENLAIQLLEDVARRDFSAIEATISVVGSLIRFGKTIYEIEPVNADMVINELGNLNAAIKEIAELSLPDSLDIADINVEERQLKKAAKHSKANAATPDNNPANNAAKALDDNPANRQSAIIERIRQFGNEPVRLKDIIASFNGISPRTLRYDLERLCNQGVIERTGPGGPATFYKIRVI